jgi:hypothetical protein
MFKIIDLSGMLGPVKNSWFKLGRQIQTEVEHKRVTNSTGNAMVRGDVVYGITGDRQVALADADASATAEWVGIMAEPTLAGAQGVMRTSGYALVKFIDGIVPVAGTPAYVSGTAGAASNADNGAFSMRIGIIADPTGYVSVQNPFAWVVLGHCCEPLVVDPQV